MRFGCSEQTRDAKEGGIWGRSGHVIMVVACVVCFSEACALHVGVVCDSLTAFGSEGEIFGGLGTMIVVRVVPGTESFALEGGVLGEGLDTLLRDGGGSGEIILLLRVGMRDVGRGLHRGGNDLCFIASSIR